MLTDATITHRRGPAAAVEAARQGRTTELDEILDAGAASLLSPGARRAFLQHMDDPGHGDHFCDRDHFRCSDRDAGPCRREAREIERLAPPRPPRLPLQSALDLTAEIATAVLARLPAPTREELRALVAEAAVLVGNFGDSEADDGHVTDIARQLECRFATVIF